jgi:hypothetical protein
MEASESSALTVDLPGGEREPLVQRDVARREQASVGLRGTASVDDAPLAVLASNELGSPQARAEER